MRTAVHGCLLFSMLRWQCTSFCLQDIALEGGVCCECGLSLCPSRAVVADDLEAIDECKARVPPQPPPPRLPDGPSATIVVRIMLRPLGDAWSAVFRVLVGMRNVSIAPPSPPPRARGRYLVVSVETPCFFFFAYTFHCFCLFIF